MGNVDEAELRELRESIAGELRLLADDIEHGTYTDVSSRVEHELTRPYFDGRSMVGRRCDGMRYTLTVRPCPTHDEV